MTVPTGLFGLSKDAAVGLLYSLRHIEDASTILQGLPLAECLTRELRAALRLVARGELPEGVTARLAERRAPHWSPPEVRAGRGPDQAPLTSPVAPLHNS